MAVFAWILSLDNAILEAIQQLRCPPLDWLLPPYSRLGDHGAICIVLALVLLLLPKTRKIGAALAMALILCLVFGNLLLKPLVGRVRPYEANGFSGLLVPPLGDFSFPSGHTFSCVAAAFVLFHYCKKAGIFAWLAAALMAFSRLYLYVHYPSDVLGGLLLGLAAGFIACHLIDYLTAGVGVGKARRPNSGLGQRISVPLFPEQRHRRRKK